MQEINDTDYFLNYFALLFDFWYNQASKVGNKKQLTVTTAKRSKKQKKKSIIKVWKTFEMNKDLQKKGTGFILVNKLTGATEGVGIPGFLMKN